MDGVKEMEAHLEKYLARSQQVKAEISGNADFCDEIRRVMNLDHYEPFGRELHGQCHSFYVLGQLESGLFVVARVPNERVYYKVGDLEYCAQESAATYADRPRDIVPSFCVGVVPTGTQYPYQLRKDKGVLLLTEDVTQGGKFTIENEPDMAYGTIRGTQKKVWYDFDKSNDRYILEEKMKDPIFFSLEHRLEL